LISSRQTSSRQTSVHAWHLFDHKAAYAKAPGFTPLEGHGGVFVANRWNLRGHPILYTASSASLASLEILVHVNPSIFGERTIIELELPFGKSDVETVSLETFFTLQRDADPDDDRRLSQRFGTTWLLEQRSLILSVPSAVVPWERNYVVNPRHPRASLIRVERQDVFRLDPRLLR
jgi:RES domain-containing protein